ncbi:hypothetical protein AMS68_005851 [Peltaster fructicola]|uniref:Nucleolar protein 9 n=1 Tax=Peltaster fructicola TaxID=286661 RepID=A0A6H0Y011_9PEZI|nr:hypothetical protein AMS68_005851 [Peltaster fructicola]
MPRENKKRGRRMENGQKRKLEDDEQQEQSIKRRKSVDDADDHIPPERPFYGLLDDDEQEFFRGADETLEANEFGDNDDKKSFLTNIYKEAEGKELKMANSQGCSRLLEKLIQLSSAEQCQNLFQKFAGNFVSLMTHRFASHCCEALFIRAAPIDLETSILDVLGEIDGSIGYLITDAYASHVLRVLLLILAGEPLSESRYVLRSKKKENTSVAQETQSRTVPNVAGLSTDKLRALATHPNANPTLQLLLRLELTHFGKQRAKDETSIIRTLLPEEPITAESDSASFLSGMVYDPVGSHLVEMIVKAAPAKLFKNLYKAILFERLPSYSRNDIASHVACRVIERLGHDDLLELHEIMIEHISDLLRKNRTNVVRTLIERCTVREIDTKVIALQIYNTWNTPEGFEVAKLLKTVQPVLSTSTTEPDPAMTEIEVTEPVKKHFNLLAQAMLIVPGALSALILDALVTLDSKTLLDMSCDPIVSRTVQAALTSKSSSIITTRKLVQHFYGQIGDMALDKAASHVVDCIWEGTHGLAFIRERIAEELAENEAQLRDSPFGRAVWKNWKMDMYKRRRADWVKQSKVKASNDGFQSFSEIDAHKNSNGDAKTPIQLARERHARERRNNVGSTSNKPDRGRRSARAPLPEAGPSTSAAAA